MKRVLTEAEANKAFRNAKLCYLCGSPLGDVRPVTKEHIIPKSFVREENLAGGGAAWYPILPVHKQCEIDQKSDLDTKVLSLYRLHKPGAPTIRRQDLKQLEPHVLEDFLRGVPLLKDASFVMLAAMNWVAGMHTFLYGAILSRVAAQIVVSPLPMVRGDSGQDLRQSLEDCARFTKVARQVLAAAGTLGVWDGVHADVVRIRYRCVWMPRRPSRDNRHPYWCLWCLDYPGVYPWSESVGGIPQPWHGAYTAYQCPPGCSYLTLEELNQASE